MSEPIHLKICPACNTGIPEEAAICPECGAVQQGEPTQRQGRAGPGPGADIFGAMFGGPEERRRGTGAMLRPRLLANLGCLLPALLIFFGIPTAIGALAGNALGGLAVPFLLIGIAGLALTAMLVWLLWPSRKNR
jgi:hypothetical protein